MTYALTYRGFALATVATATLFASAPHAFAQSLTIPAVRMYICSMSRRPRLIFAISLM